MRPVMIDLPDDAGILDLVSPAFDARYPRVVNKELIPPSILQAMEWAWRTPRFPERPVRVARLRDVWVAKEGLVFDHDGSLYAQTVTQHSPAEVEQAHAAVLAAMGRGWKADADGPVLLCKKRGIGNYGHWLMEMLPKAHLVHSRLRDLDVRFLVADVPGRLRESMAYSLALLGVDLARTIVADDTPRRFADLLVVDGLSEHGGFMSPLTVGTADALARDVASQTTERLFITRKSMGFRRVVDEDALLERARSHGYTPVDPAEMPLPDQIALFKGASRIVGVMGAAMTNTVFAPPGARVVTLTPAGMPDTFFWFIATLRGHDYTEFRCAQSGPVQGTMPWDTDMVLPPDGWDRLFAD